MRIYQGVCAEALFEFGAPSEMVYQQIQGILQQLEIQPKDLIDDPRTHPDFDPIHGNLEDTMRQIRAMLDQDSAINARECAEWNGSFEFGIGFMNTRKDLAIWTRLYSGDRGSVYYSSTIRRIAADEFLIWDGHTDLGEDDQGQE